MFGAIGRGFFKPKPIAETADTELIYIYLPASLEPDHRFEVFETALDAELRLAGVGWISGGGTLLSAPDEDGTRHIEFCGIDADVLNLAAGRALLRTHLPILGCPSRTALWYSERGRELQDEYNGAEWQLSLQRVERHPGFDV